MTELNQTRQDNPPLLDVRDLQVTFASDLGTVAAVNGVNLTLEAGQTLVVLGESGSGKSVTAQAIMGVIPRPPGQVTAARLAFDGKDLLGLSPKAYRALRGRDMALIFQDALTSLNPRFTIGTQITQMLRHHRKMPKALAWARAEELLTLVGIPDPVARLQAYPHQLSGGMRQRALIAMSVALDPKILIADEPTTALDVTVQAQVLDLMKSLQERAGMGLILITHDLAVAKQIADRVLVMYAGEIVEEAPTEELFKTPAHPYTRGLMQSMPSLAGLGKALTPIPGSPPDLRALPSGCPFRTRCAQAQAICAEQKPVRQWVSPLHSSLCHFAGATA